MPATSVARPERRFGTANPLRPPAALLKRYFSYFLIGCVILALTVHIAVFQSDWSRLEGLAGLIRTIGWFLPDLAFLPQVIKPLFDTFLMALWGTLIATVLAIPVAWLAAHNVTPFYPLTYPLGRLIIVLSRSVHELIFALVLVAALGLGAFPGILALACRSIGFLAKTTAEAIEHIDRRPVEAIEATGAGRFAVIVYAVIPQVFPIFVGNMIFQLDINLRRAAILGMVGAGGIGMIFAEQMMSLAYDRAGTVVLGIVVMVILGEYASNRIRTRLL